LDIFDFYLLDANKIMDSLKLLLFNH